jgi:hypothetical protein
MKKIVPILVLVLLSSSALCVSVSADVDGATVTKAVEPGTLLPDVYMTTVNNVSYLSMRANSSNYPVFWRLYEDAPGKEALVNTGLKNRSLLPGDYATGKGLLYIFTYDISDVWTSVNGMIDFEQHRLVEKGLSFSLYSGQPVKITVGGTYSRGLTFGFGDWNTEVLLKSKVTSLTVQAPGEWRLYTNYNHNFTEDECILLPFAVTIEYEDISDTGAYGFLILAVAAACLAPLVFSGLRQRIKD